MRTFVAVELPEKLQKEIGELAKSLDKIIPLRLIAPQNLHLTLFFLGEVPKERITEVIKAVALGCQGVKPFLMSLGEPEFFPPKGRAHGLWLKIEGQVESLGKLYQKLTQELKKRNFEFDRRPFSAHITLGRAKRRIKRIESLGSIKGVQGKIRVSSVTIFTSELTPEGSIYSKIETIPLE